MFQSPLTKFANISLRYEHWIWANHNLMFSTRDFGKLPTVSSSAKTLFVGKLSYSIKLQKCILCSDTVIFYQKSSNINLHIS